MREIEVRSYCGEPHLMEKLDLREVNIETINGKKHLFIKIDGDNNKTGKREQLQFHVNTHFTEELINGINACVKAGLFEEEKH